MWDFWEFIKTQDFMNCLRLYYFPSPWRLHTWIHDDFVRGLTMPFGGTQSIQIACQMFILVRFNMSFGVRKMDSGIDPKGWSYSEIAPFRDARFNPSRFAPLGFLWFPDFLLRRCGSQVLLGGRVPINKNKNKNKNKKST